MIDKTELENWLQQQKTQCLNNIISTLNDHDIQTAMELKERLNAYNAVLDFINLLPENPAADPDREVLIKLIYRETKLVQDCLETARRYMERATVYAQKLQEPCNKCADSASENSHQNKHLCDSENGCKNGCCAESARNAPKNDF